MGDVLAGNHAVWEFDSDSVLIRFVRGIRTPRLWHALGERRIPLEALSGVSVEVTGGRRDAVVLRAVPRAGADPLMEAAAGQLKEVCDPYRLTLPGDRAAQAGEFADALRERLDPGAAEPCDHFLVDVPQPPLHLKAYDARVGFDGSAVTFQWSRTGASSTKWRAGDQRFALTALSGVEWVSPERPGIGHLRLLPRDPAPGVGDPRADHDLAAAVFGIGYGAVHESLPFAAAVLAALRARTPVASLPRARSAEAARLRHLSELYGAGLLTDSEYEALRERLSADA
ncbi:DUF4429 domain-containing protein [Streptomyces sp. NPDC029003]|uniref:DUF4429 domain-containing protein n=1 Tax=Streptomyces sp. NPDC029003 TaxID=3155125 RepID=UPI0033CE5077